MARKPRIHYDGALYHVMLRGNGGDNVFFEVKDFLEFENLLGDGVKRFGHRILAYCCMSNHVHLLIQVGEITLSKIIQNISFRYTRYINKKLKRMGHLFQGRYKAIIIDMESYLLELVRYIHLNPKRAKLEKKLGDYKWSSHLSYLGERDIEWLDKIFVLSHFSKRKNTAIKHYLNFLNAVKTTKKEQTIKSFLSGQDGGILGDDNFAKEIQRRINSGNKPQYSINILINKFCKHKNIKKDIFVANPMRRNNLKDRNFLIYLCLEYGEDNLQEIANKFNLSLSMVSKIKHLFLDRMRKNKKLKKEIENMKELFV